MISGLHDDEQSEQDSRFVSTERDQFSRQIYSEVGISWVFGTARVIEAAVQFNV